ncbi:putative ABC transport system ATP-binding protein/osmoprotectant transport system ATP-binding protein [Amycolatopsis arida]|uniref:Putative ABC transport system ATP-binding protein/osmoprotectant transport system ATP-binding protein n=2 Tax=Amycolatopsis arida TaxID=587909 RepID=A0A1I6B0B4_9PSEU|nr:ABC transporter family protein [Amycolatopsis arida]SFQ74398.1 putative ABC transport system ATP-binding protein/osmoprotectant transport system ATP-binding protein [Amycolatopsis arida]
MLLRLLNRLDDSTGGRVPVDGSPIGEADVLALRRRVVLVGQRPVLLTASVAAELRVGHGDLATEDADRLLVTVGLPAHYRRRSTSDLSGGQVQRLCQARARWHRKGCWRSRPATWIPRARSMP